jgi:hypothetical protein
MSGDERNRSCSLCQRDMGAILFVLCMIPGLLAALMEGLRNFRDHFSRTRRPFHNIQTDLPLSLDIWLLVGGGVMMIVGLQALLSS